MLDVERVASTLKSLADRLGSGEPPPPPKPTVEQQLAEINTKLTTVIDSLADIKIILKGVGMGGSISRSKHHP